MNKHCTQRVQVPNNHILTQKPVLQLLLPKAQVPHCWVLGPSRVKILGSRHGRQTKPEPELLKDGFVVGLGFGV